MKKRLLKLFSFMFCLCFLGGSLSACGGKTDDQETTSSTEDDVTISESEEKEESSEHSGDSWKLIEYSDGTSQYWDYNRKVSFVFPTSMTVLIEGIGESIDATIVGDNKDGYAIVDNLTDEWNCYDGTHDEFLYDYMDGYLYELFTPLYGEWKDNTHNVEMANEYSAYFSGNFWNDSWDIQVDTTFYIDEDGCAIMKCLLFNHGDYEQYEELWNGVIGITGL